MAENRTSFQPGNSGNPGGRRKDPEKFAEFRERCRALEPKALAALEAKLADGDLKAAELVLNYAWGKPPQAITGEGGEGPPVIQIVRRIVDPQAPQEPSDAG